METEEKEMTLEEIVHIAVNAQRIAGERQARDTFVATEKRLYAYPILKLKVQNDREKIQEIQQHGVPGKSKMVVRFLKSGNRLTPDEIKDALIQDIEAQIAENEAEIVEIDRALGVIAGDPYEEIVRQKYFFGKNIEEIAATIFIDPRTVARHRSRLIERIAVFLYGKTAV